jgi:Fe2+ or Zn2+ uptake regulation protein
MPFPQSVKDGVLRMAAFRCCRCEKIGGVEVHHIIPEEFGGSDDIDNAAPLCPNCHTDFGDNPKKRKEITKLRDWWYQVAKAKYPTKVIGVEKLDEINEKIGRYEKGLSDIGEIKAMLRPLLDNLMNTLTPSTASKAASSIVDTVVSSTGMSTIPVPKVHGTGHSVIMCKECGAFVDVEGNYCSKCGTKLNL